MWWVRLAVMLSLAGLATACAAQGRPVVRRSELAAAKYQRLAPPESRGRLGPLDLAAVRAVRNQESSPRSAGVPLPRSGKSTYIVYNLEFDGPEACGRFNPEGITVYNRFDRFADLYVPYQTDQQVARAQLAIRTAAGLVRAESGGLISPPPLPEPEASRTRAPVSPEAVVRGGLDGLTGKGVIVAIVDSGLDFRHPDFITTAADGKPQSRVLYLWDTAGTQFEEGKGGSKPPLSYPDGTPVGTLYTRDQLTAELRASTPALPPMDLNTHGTACAGIAAGNGRASQGRHAGAAPEADIIAVRIAGPDGHSTQNTYLLNFICGWIDRVAAARPAVVSCSFGGHYGGHDGHLVEERQLNARFSPSTRSRALCIAAGNEGSQKLHAEAAVGDEKSPAKLAWKSESGGRLSLFFGTDRAEDLAIAPVGAMDVSRRITDVSPFSRQVCVQMNVPAGAAGILVTTRGQPVRCDAYLQDGEFDDGVASFGKMVCTPGLANNAITAGSYDWNDQLERDGRQVRLVPNKKPLVLGALSGYSNPGPSRNVEGTVKPEIVAPGQFFLAPVARDAAGQPIRAPLLDGTGSYRPFNGTSAATPYVAGIVALMFERKPGLTVGEIRELLRRHASADDFTGKVPNSQWGYGKLDMKAVRAILGAIR